MQVALDVVLGANPSSSSVVNLFYSSLVGSAAPADILSEYSELIDNGSLSAAQLGIAAADHSLNVANIDLIGLSQTVIEYDIFYG